MDKERGYVAPTRQQLHDRDLKLLKDKGKYVFDNNLFVPMGRLLGISLKRENDGRFEALKNNREPTIDGAYLFYRDVAALRIPGVGLWDYSIDSSKVDLSKSLDSVLKSIYGRKLDENSPIYHLCAVAFNKDYQGAQGYAGLGKRGISVIFEVDSLKQVRPTLIKKLLE